MNESQEARHTKSNIELDWTLAEFQNFICQSYPHIRLRLVDFQLARAGKGRRMKILHVSSVRELKAAVGKSRIYIVPQANVLQVTSTPAISTTADETAQVENVVSDQALQEWRAVRANQEQEYNESLLVDQEMELKRLAYQACAASRQKMLFDFVGQDDIANEIFVVQEATSSKSIESTSSGSIMDHGIQSSAVLYVLWFSTEDVQTYLSDQQNDSTHGLHHTSLCQSLSEPSTQPMPDVPSLRLMPTSPQPAIAVPAHEPMLDVPSLRLMPTSPQPMPAVPTPQLMPTVPSSQPSLFESSTQALVSEPSVVPLSPWNSYSEEIFNFHE
ncbi:uncharacterized protein LOC110966400 isoform X3 [Acanthochromis polyacanthus]|uniref:uncharacterized protein LOC110966400 isoform X3 n=1 Tax=Acanthochromis polyacanthus TaxID=80966 RepID=UPI002233F501|nr:uncharacterized protein LOC110966400 isoform X3 [Acanthochromis polyacanthus]